MIYCCKELADHVTTRCEEHDSFDCPDQVIVATNSGYGLPIHDGGSSYIEIKHCPWCGSKV